ncbi:hypothetical protein [Frondihabitans sp. PAMC 28766]|uniref:hypothetical protein n=1 Tax=Frondihabitans sp. PAMC 28766 TaxID=1795630 RepID=UPI0012FF6C4A|nr:hypothetical protein [Frondihabitans sp. PAMC 28766]
MNSSPSSAQEHANALWLLGHAASEHVRDAVARTDDVDDLIRRALDQDHDVESVAANSFLDPDLIRHVQGGGTSLSFFLHHPASDDTVQPDQRQ